MNTGGMSRAISVYEEMVLEQAKHIRAFFEEGDMTDRERVDRLNRCDRALKVTSTYARMIASRANTGAVLLAAGSALGVSHEAAVRVVEMLTGASAEVMREGEAALAVEAGEGDNGKVAGFGHGPGEETKEGARKPARKGR